jgi:arginine deiminase
MLERKGVEVIEVEVGEIRKGRGAIHCMTGFLAREW